MRRVAIALVCVALVAAGCGGDDPPSEDPGAFASSLVTEIYAGRSGPAWDTLHPRHQEVVSRARYVECERLAPLAERLRRVEVVRVADAPSTVPGDPEEVRSKAVDVRLTLTLPGVEQPQDITHTVHLFAVDGRWAWVIGPTDFASYASGNCPAGG